MVRWSRLVRTSPQSCHFFVRVRSCSLRYESLSVESSVNLPKHDVSGTAMYADHYADPFSRARIWQSQTGGVWDLGPAPNISLESPCLPYVHSSLPEKAVVDPPIGIGLRGTSSLLPSLRPPVSPLPPSSWWGDVSGEMDSPEPEEGAKPQ